MIPPDTARLTFRRPLPEDAPSIFARYASDPEVTKYLSWPRHTSVEDAKAFVRFSDSEWGRGPTGPLLILSRRDGVLLGGTGLTFELPDQASTGYVLARAEWGKGYATEALGAMVALARAVGVSWLSAICHVDHQPSWHVMEKCGFEREGLLARHTVFPNLSPERADVLLYRRRCQP